MLLKTDSVELWMLIAFIVGFFSILAYVVVLKKKMRNEKRAAIAITKHIVEYFHKTGVTVTVSCISPRRNGRYTALIESEPMKQFRLSHIIETTLRDHITKTCGMRLENIFWRFPIKEAALAASTELDAEGKGKPKEGSDEYINEGLLHYKDVPKIEVTELTWENFEEAATVESGKKPAKDEPKKTTEE